MVKLYDKRETAETVEYEFHLAPVATWLFFVAVGASLVGCKRTTRLSGMLLVLWVIGIWPAWMELEEAMKNGSVSVSGSKLSFDRPLKVVITRK
jgi:hypothetical protein